MDWGGMKRFINSISLPSKEDKEGGFGRKGPGVAEGEQLPLTPRR